MTPVPPELAAAREQFLALVADLRPELHRYVSRLVGSAIDGEDVVQEALAKAFYAVGLATELPPLRPWLFRIAHNTAIDFLRRYDRRHVEPMAEVPDSIAPEADPAVVREALSTFMALPVSQRSAVILKDVLGHTSEEIAEATGTTVSAVKSLLVRGRASLRERARPEAIAWRDRPETGAVERALIARYVSLFNARDWDGVRDMLLEECRLDLVSKATRQGKGVGGYLTRYQEDASGWRLAHGRAEGRDAILVYRGDSQRPAYLILLDWDGDQVALIRDFRYVPYLMDEIDLEGEPNAPA